MTAEAITFRTLLSGAITTTAAALPYLAECRLYAGEEDALLDGKAIVAPAVLFSIAAIQPAERAAQTVGYMTFDALLTARVVAKSLGDVAHLLESDDHSAYAVIEDVIGTLAGSDLGLTGFRALALLGWEERIVRPFGSIHAVNWRASFNLARRA